MKHCMKLILALISCAVIYQSCTYEGPSPVAAVSFVSDRPEIQADSAIFIVTARGISSAEDISIPVTFSGSAEKGTDYTASAETFVIGGESPSDSIIIRTLILGSQKTLELSLNLPEGIEGGFHTSSGFTLQDRFGHLSFKTQRAMAADTLQLTIQVQDQEGKNSKASGPGTFAIGVDTEKSTASEGVHFSFIDGNSVSLNSGSASASLRIAPISDSIAGDCDKVVLVLEAGDCFYAGLTDTLEISLLDSKWAALDGKWTADSLVTDSTFMAGYWDQICTGLDLLPEYESSDAITFNLSESNVSTSFRSSFKNYFSGVSELTKGKEIALTLADGETVGLQTFTFSNTNRYFSAEEKSEDGESVVGFRLITEDGTEKELLDMYVIDYTSRSFMPELDSLGRYGTSKPVAAEPGLYLNLRFSR